MSASLVFLVALVGILLFFVGVYNRLVTYRNRYKNAFSQIDVQLKRRYDLIPNLVETAKAYLKHERETLEAVTLARTQAVGAAGRAAARPGEAAVMAGLGTAEAALSGALGRLLAVVESYPDLKANQTMGRLMEELTSTENRVSFARQAFNDAVMQYNTAREVFPNSLVAGAFDFQPAVLFEIANPAEKEGVRVGF